MATAKKGQEKRTSLLKKGIFWTPKKDGSVMRGTYQGEGKTQYGNAFRFLGENDEAILVPKSSVLADLDLSPYKGKVIEVTFLGTIAGKNGMNYKNYSVDLIESGEVSKF